MTNDERMKKSESAICNPPCGTPSSFGLRRLFVVRHSSFVISTLMADDLAIDVRGMTKRFDDRTVVNDIALQVRTGEIYGFLGPNGSGKTTFIRMLCGLLRPDAGSGTCLGHDVIKDSESIKRSVGYMTQRFSFWEDLSI